MPLKLRNSAGRRARHKSPGRKRRQSRRLLERCLASGRSWTSGPIVMSPPAAARNYKTVAAGVMMDMTA